MNKTTGLPVLYDLPELDAFSNDLEPKIKSMHAQVEKAMKDKETYCN